MANLAETHLFEASWEVCNKVGGIHTVITSKLPHAQRTFGDGYMPVGPWLGESQHTAFKEEALPPSWKEVVVNLNAQGVSLHYGKWLVDEEPPTILVGWEGLLGQLDAIKGQLWEKYQLNTLGSNFYDIDQPLLWSVAVGKLVQAFAEANQKPVILHAHEWLTGSAILVIDHPQVRTVFTTHATVLGRALSSQNTFIYDKLSRINPTEEAERLQVTTKHQIERLSAQQASIFTTVSEITADESAAFLGRRPEVTTENGISLDQFPTYDEIARQRLAMRGVLDDFCAAYFFPHYQFDLAQTNYQYTMGRYETHNKGYDLYLQALGTLNKRLIEEKSEKTVVALFLVPGDVLRLRPNVATQLSAFRQMRDLLRAYTSTLPAELYSQYFGNQPEGTIPAELRSRLDQLRSHIPPTAQPALSPYDFRTSSDSILGLAAQYDLQNRAEDRVKVVFFPIYFDSFDGIFNLPLYDIISGCALGVFPSLYEPWGYTPLESIMMGVPALTSTVAGFGQASKEFNSEGVMILNRSHNAPEEEHQKLTDLLHEAALCDHRSWNNRRIAAYQLAEQFSWETLYERYRQAYNKSWE